MKRLLLLLFCAQIAYGQPNSVTRNYFSGLGPVMANDGLGRLNSEIWRDQENRVVKEVLYHYDKAIARITEHKYNQDGNLILKCTIDYSKQYWQNLKSKLTSYHYDIPDTTFTSYSYKAGLLTKQSSYKRNRKDSSFVYYKYNSDRNIVEIKTIDQWQRVSWKEFRHYKNGQLVSKSHWRGTNYSTGYKLEPSGFASFVYDSKNRLIKELWAKDSLSPSSSGKKFKYTEFDSISAEGYIDEHGKTAWNKSFFYNDQHQLIKNGNGEHFWENSYDEKGYLIERKYMNERISNENIVKYVYEGENLIREETWYNGERTGYEEMFYSKTGRLIRRQPMKRNENQAALDWIKKYSYDRYGRLNREEYIHPNQQGNLVAGIYHTWDPNGKTPQPAQKKEDPYKNYITAITRYEYNKQGDLIRTYMDGQAKKLIILSDSGYTKHSRINVYEENVLFGNKADTISDRYVDGVREIKFLYNKIYRPFSRPNEVEGDQMMQRVKRVESRSARGDIIRIEEYDRDGQLLCIHAMQEGILKGKQLVNFIKRSETKIVYYTVMDPIIRVTAQEALKDGLLSSKIESWGHGTDSITYTYKNDRLFRAYRLFNGGAVKQLTEYHYDEQGFKTSELIYDENGSLNYRVLYKNDGKHIIEKNRHALSEGNIVRNVIEYF